MYKLTDIVLNTSGDFLNPDEVLNTLELPDVPTHRHQLKIKISDVLL